MTVKNIITDDFLLHTNAAKTLYVDYAKNQPIFDYHSHLSAKDIAEDRQFDNLTQIWLTGDHYKYRAMRANGIDEHFITGNASDFDKFYKWAATVPYTLRNSLYHWTHLELKRYFDIEEVLNTDTAASIYAKVGDLLQQKDYSVQNLLRKMNVCFIGTTDDPIDDLQYHQKLQEQGFEIQVLPSFRPDKALQLTNEGFLEWIAQLEQVVGYAITSYESLVKALHERHTFFHEVGCRISDHGLSTLYFEKTTSNEVSKIFKKAMQGEHLSKKEIRKYQSALLIALAEMNHSKGWVQQFHIGAIRNTNQMMWQSIGADQGFDSIGDFSFAPALSGFFGALSATKSLAKTIVYNLNPKDSEMMATMLGNFNDDGQIGKMQYGAAWWFLDQKKGIENQIDVLSNYGLLSHFVGMVTDSRSFLSFPRHEYFRRILCNLLGEEMEKKELPMDFTMVGALVSSICYHNAARYFNYKRI
jgi:glucuronate isomerase